MSDNATVKPPAKPFFTSKLNWTGVLLIIAGLGMFSSKFPPAYGKVIVEIAGWAVIILRTWYTDSAVKIGGSNNGSNNEKETEIMAQGQNTATGIGLGLQALIQGLVWFLGTRKVAASDGTLMTGPQKSDHITANVLSFVAPLAEAGAEMAAENQKNVLTKASIQETVQIAHAALLANGEIQDTATLNAQPGPAVAAPVIPAPATNAQGGQG